MRINFNLKVFLSIIERSLCKMGTPHKLAILFKVVGYSFTNVSPTRLLIVIVLNSCLLNWEIINNPWQETTSEVVNKSMMSCYRRFFNELHGATSSFSRRTNRLKSGNLSRDFLGKRKKITIFVKKELIPWLLCFQILDAKRTFSDVIWILAIEKVCAQIAWSCMSCKCVYRCYFKLLIRQSLYQKTGWSIYQKAAWHSVTEMWHF